MTPTASPDDSRILVLAPRGRDAAVVCDVLEAQQLPTRVCETLGSLVERLHQGAGLVFVTEEALEGPQLPRLTQWLTAQPSWSDMPIVVLAAKRIGRRSAQALATLEGLGNAVLLERPLNSETLVSAARSALRSRNRQYETRHHLQEQERIGRENARLYEAERAALQEAAEVREALALALQAAELGTFHCPLPLGSIVWNETARSQFWLAPDAGIDFDRFYTLLHPDDRERTREAVRAAVEEGAPYDVEYRTVSASGLWRWIRAKGRCYGNGDGQPRRFDGITIDISHQKALEAERETLLDAERAARMEAERASRMKDEFLATLSHELRTPLSAILGWSHVLKKRADGVPELAKGMETIERNARAQAMLIDELLDMSRIVAGNARLEMHPLMPADIVQSVLGSMQPAAEAKAMTLEHHVDPDAGPVNADPHRLEQIVRNLLANAIKFTPAGGRVAVALKAEAGAVLLQISDDGPGIAPDFLPFVFDRFRQADGSTTRTHGGLGLGLAIVRHLVELHGGAVQAHSEGLGRGSVFTVRLPLGPDGAAVAMPASAGADGRTAAPATPAGPVAPAAGAAELDGLRIMLVDDDSDGRDMIARILQDRGAAITTAGSADEALSVMHGAGADVLISDIGMPRVDGYELLLRARTLGHRLPAIALTAFARAEDRLKALAAGYALHLAKPVEPDALVASVARLAGRGRRGRP